MSALQDQLEGLPGYDILIGYWDDYASEHLNTADPFEDKEGNKRRISREYNTKMEQKIWKKVQSSAWTHDKCFLGSCGVGMDCGLGLAPLVVLFFPVLGPLIMYGVHSRLIHVMTNDMRLPPKIVAKMEANIVFDLIITFPPIIGCFLGYLNACSTRNAGLAYKYFIFLAEQRQKNNQPVYMGRVREEQMGTGYPEPGIAGGYTGSDVAGGYTGTRGRSKYSNPDPIPVKNSRFKKPPVQENIVVQDQQQQGFV